MMPATHTGEAFSIGRVASRTFGVIGRNAVPFFSLAAIAAIPQIALKIILGQQNLNPAHIGGFFLTTFGVAWVNVALLSVLQAALVHGTISDLNGKKASFGDCLQTGLKTALPVIGISILQSLGVGFGLILLIVPGILFAIAWSVAVPVRVVEQESVFECFGRSSDLTRGHRGAIFVLALIWWFIAFALGMVIVPISGLGSLAAAARATSITYAVLEGVVAVFTSTVSAAGIASIYYELRWIKEGIGPEQLAAVFD